jgi:hypothetical protein
MNHREAVEGQAAERYLLMELSPAEREEFEEHFFGCAACAAAVEAGVVFAANARAVLSERAGRHAPIHHRWLEWRRPAYVFAIAGLLLFLIAYEELLRIPRLQREWAAATAPQAYPAFFLRPVARGDDQVLEVPKAAPFVGLALDVPPGGVYRSFECDLRGGSPLTIAVPAPASPGAPLNILVPLSRLRPGPYLLILRGRNDGSEAVELSRFSFAIRFN